jgi:hypothetical protein
MFYQTLAAPERQLKTSSSRQLKTADSSSAAFFFISEAYFAFAKIFAKFSCEDFLKVSRPVSAISGSFPGYTVSQSPTVDHQTVRPGSDALTVLKVLNSLAVFAGIKYLLLLVLVTQTYMPAPGAYAPAWVIPGAA